MDSTCQADPIYRFNGSLASILPCSLVEKLKVSAGNAVPFGECNVVLINCVQ